MPTAVHVHAAAPNNHNSQLLTSKVHACTPLIISTFLACKISHISHITISATSVIIVGSHLRPLAAAICSLVCACWQPHMPPSITAVGQAGVIQNLVRQAADAPTQTLWVWCGVGSPVTWSHASSATAPVHAQGCYSPRPHTGLLQPPSTHRAATAPGHAQGCYSPRPHTELLQPRPHTAPCP